MNFNDLKNEIKIVPKDEPVFVYLGIGTASNQINDDIILKQENYHQYPSFVQDLHNKIPNLHVFLVLMDSFQENPPRVAIDYNLHPQSNNREGENPYHYKNGDNTLQAFVYRKNVYTDADNRYYENNRENDINITEELTELNHFLIENNGSLLCDMFTGKSIAPLADYFDCDYSIQQKTDQIVYGMNAREDHGCLFDLTQPNAYFPVRIETSKNKRPIVKMFNYYHMIVNNRLDDMEIESEVAKYPVETHSMIDRQKNQIIQNIITKFRNTNMGILRQVRKLQQEAKAQAPAEEVEYPIFEIKQLPLVYQTILSELIKEQNHEMIYDMIFNYTATELNILALLRKMDITGEEILKFITQDEDPFKWYNNIKNFI